MEQLYVDKDDNFYAFPKEGARKTTKAYYEKIMTRRREAELQTPEYKRMKRKADIAEIIDDMSIGEAIYHVLKYVQAKTSQNGDTESIAWGDKMINDIGKKINEN